MARPFGEREKGFEPSTASGASPRPDSSVTTLLRAYVPPLSLGVVVAGARPADRDGRTNACFASAGGIRSLREDGVSKITVGHMARLPALPVISDGASEPQFSQLRGDLSR